MGIPNFTVSTGSLSNDPNTAWDVTVSQSIDPTTLYDINGSWILVSILSDTPHRSTQLNVQHDNGRPHSLPTIHLRRQPFSTSHNTPPPPPIYESHHDYDYEDAYHLETDYYHQDDPTTNPPPSSYQDPSPPPPPQYINDDAIIPPHQYTPNTELIPPQNPSLLHPVSYKDNNDNVFTSAPYQHTAPSSAADIYVSSPTLPIPLPIIDNGVPFLIETTTLGTVLPPSANTTTNTASTPRRSNSTGTAPTTITPTSPRYSHSTTRKGTTPKLRRLLTPRCPPKQLKLENENSRFGDTNNNRKSPSPQKCTGSNNKRPAWSNVFNHVRSLSGGPPRPLCTFHHSNSAAAAGTATVSQQKYDMQMVAADAVRWTPDSPPPRPRRSSNGSNGNNSYRQQHFYCTTSHSFSPEGHHMHVGIGSLGGGVGGGRRRDGSASTRDAGGGMRSSMGEYNRGGVGGLLPTVDR